MGSRAWIGVLLAAATIAVYAQVREHEFVNYDDPIYLEAIAPGFGAQGLRMAFTREIVANWIPVTWTMLLIDHDLYGRNPAGYLLTNVAIHVANTLLLFALLASWTGATGRSAFVAAVFALHPLHVESVAWLSERKDVLSAFFFLLTLFAYRHYTTHPTRGRYASVFVLLALGLMSKPMLVTLPFVLLLLDYWPLGRIGTRDTLIPVDFADLARAAREKSWLFGIAAAACAVALFTQNLTSSMPDTQVLTVGRRVANAVDSVWIYVAQSFWPTGLAVFYPHPVELASIARTAGLALLLLLTTGAAVRLGARHPHLLVGWLWYLGMLVPVVGLVQVGSQAHADRYTYLPQIGLAIAFTWSAHAALVGTRYGLRVLRVAGGAIAVALAITSAVQVGYWKDPIALNTRAVAVTRDNDRAHHSLAGALRRAGRLEEAAVHYAIAARLTPGRARTQIGRAEVLAELGRLDEAIDAYRVGLRLSPQHVRGHINLGHVLLRAEQFEQARRSFARAFEIGGDEPGTWRKTGTLQFLISLHRGMARALGAVGEPEAAIEHWESLLDLRPKDAAAHIAVGEQLLKIGRDAEARAHIFRGRELGPPPTRRRSR